MKEILRGLKKHPRFCFHKQEYGFDDAEVQELEDDHSEERGVELQSEQMEAIKEDYSSGEEDVREVTVPIGVIKDMCSKWNELQEICLEAPP